MKSVALIKHWADQLHQPGKVNTEQTIAGTWYIRLIAALVVVVLAAGVTIGLRLSARHNALKNTPSSITGSTEQPAPNQPAQSPNSGTSSKSNTPKSSSQKTIQPSSIGSAPVGSSSGTKSSPKTPSVKTSASSKSKAGSTKSSGSSSGGGSSTALKLAIPTYWWTPSSYDTQLDNAGSKVGFVVANINSGPGTSGTESNFNTEINNERAAGIKVYGYVYTNYGSRALSDVKTDIDNWYSWYNLDGILFDEAPGTGWTSAQKTYYQSLYSYVKTKTGTYVHGKTVVLNPGTATDEYAMSVSDIVSDYEDTGANYAGTSFPSWTKNYAATRFWNIIHTSSGVSQMQNDIELAKTRNVGYVYVTTDSGSNPYDTLPGDPFWTDELNAL